MHTYNLTYLFKGEPRDHRFALKQPGLSLHEAALHLILLHYGDGENSLVMPAADASPTEILQQASSLEITRVEVHPGE
ncbi:MULTISPECIES: hypothetical protein [Pseudomonas]|uniref:hypothetical protein n=1 Tax=Pseudomonas TaxID=286 RepID=UPI001573C329|nr:MULTISPECIES: hypothetical protein [Pseudomonas]MBG6128221.1 hypothetical protein [Pseudomonas sp. M2]NSX19268.1 hypothetical protein [Pseudomonas putida]HDS1744096.1 hypothetical protein [Pseudomonas putida]